MKGRTGWEEVGTGGPEDSLAQERKSRQDSVFGQDPNSYLQQPHFSCLDCAADFAQF